MAYTQEIKSTISQKMLKIARLGWTYTRDHLSDSKLSFVQYRVCEAIYSEPEASQDDVARRLGMDKSSVAKLVFKLIELGYVERAVNPRDRRQYKLYLTERGVEKTEEFLHLLIEWEESVFGAVGPAAYEECQKNLTMVLDLALQMEE